MSYRLDRTAFHAGTHDQNAQYHATHQPATPTERLRAAAYLNSVAFGYDLENSPRMDRTAFFLSKARIVMANLFNIDFQDFLRALRRCEVRYVLVGGYSVILHGYSRTTGDLDIWVERTADNYERLVQAFQVFGMPTFDMTAHNFLHNPAMDVFTFGRPPAAIDIITQLKGLDFANAYDKASDAEVDELTIRLIHYEHLLQAKTAAGRPRDQNDIENLLKREE